MSDEPTWHRIGSPGLSARVGLGVIGLGPLTIFLFFGNSVMRTLFDGQSLWTYLLLIPAYAVLFVLLALIFAVARPSLHISDDGSYYRIGRRSLPADSLVRVLNRSQMGWTARSPLTEIVLLGPERGPLARVIVRRGGREYLDDADRERLLALAAHSSARYPSSSYDPSNRFAAYNFPESLDKAKLLELLTPPSERPPGAAEASRSNRTFPKPLAGRAKPPTARGRSTFPW
jgi:hypothetical protein